MQTPCGHPTWQHSRPSPSPAPPSSSPPQQEVERLTAAAEAVYSENAALNRQQAALSSEVKGLKQGANALTDEAAGLRLRLSAARGEEELLRSQVVQSPQKAAAALEALAAALDRERIAVSDAERRHRDTTARTDAVQRVSCWLLWLPRTPPPFAGGSLFW